jgi:hypothetical protein
MKSVMDHSFSQVPRADIQRSSFDRSHGHKTTFDAGKLVPIFVDEALPGDTFNMSMTAFGRMTTPIYPIMDNMHIDVHFFAVPMRQLWTNFRKFMGEQANPDDSTDFTVPMRSITTGVVEGTFEDYIGLPIGSPLSYNALFQRAYVHIFNEWYRDQNLIDSTFFSLTDSGGTSTGGQGLLTRGKRHDYFTSCLPWPQKGDSVLLPLGDKANIHTDADVGQQVGVYSDETLDYHELVTGAGNRIDISSTVGTTPENNKLYASLTDATAATINEIRQAFQIQKLLERDARGGTRYAEIIDSHFGVKFLDVTYRPEYLGGGSGMININPVTQTSATDAAVSPQGNMSGFGTIGLSNVGFVKSFTEHCIIMGIASVRADLTYQQGINRMFSRSTRYDFYWPALAHIGEQAVLNKEIYYQNTSADSDVFGYQERYAEYRYKPSIITGKMRSDATGTLDAWHLSQDFSSLPVLNEAFINENPPMDRILAVTNEPHFIFDSYFQLRCVRPMPLFGVPGFMDRF